MSSGATVYAGQMTYKPFGGLESMALGNGTTLTMGYSPTRLQLSSMTLAQGATTLQRYDYKYGRVNMTTGAVDEAKNNGQLGSVEATIGTERQWQQRLEYDSLGRLTSAGEYYGNNLQGRTYLLNYEYDAYGNRFQQQSRNQNNPVGQSWVEGGAYDALTNRLASGLTYDEAGNVTRDGRFRMLKLRYDANNRQRQSSSLSDTNVVESVYDGLGQRVALKAGGNITSVMVYDVAGALVAEYGGSVSAGGTQYVMSDHQGSPRVTMRGAAVNGQLILARQDYLPFGEDVPGAVGPRAGVAGYDQGASPRQRYAGMERDEATGMSHTRWREFDSKSARWTAPDPYGGSMELADPQTLNRYSYVGNDPVNQVDPQGLQSRTCGGNNGTPCTQADDYKQVNASELDQETFNAAYMRYQVSRMVQGYINADFAWGDMPSMFTASVPEPQTTGGSVTLQVRGKEGQPLSRGNRLRYPGRRQTLGPAYLNKIKAYGWQVEISGTTPDDITTWTIYQDWEEVDIFDDTQLGVWTTPVMKGRDEIQGRPVYTQAAKGGRRFYYIDAPGFHYDAVPSHARSVRSVTNFTTYMKKGDVVVRKVEWSITATMVGRTMTEGNFHNRHMPLQ